MIEKRGAEYRGAKQAGLIKGRVYDRGRSSPEFFNNRRHFFKGAAGMEDFTAGLAGPVFQVMQGQHPFDLPGNRLTGVNQSYFRAGQGLDNAF